MTETKSEIAKNVQVALAKMVKASLIHNDKYATQEDVRKMYHEFINALLPQARRVGIDLGNIREFQRMMEVKSRINNNYAFTNDHFEEVANEIQALLKSHID